MIILNSQLNSHIVNHCGSEENVSESETSPEDEVKGHDITVSVETHMSFISLLKTVRTLSPEIFLRIAVPIIYFFFVFWKSSLVHCALVMSAVQLLISEYRYCIRQRKHTEDHTDREDEHHQKYRDKSSHKCSALNCRIKIQSILGEIQAPPLTPISRIGASCESLDHDVLLNFTKTQSELFQSLDSAIYNLRIITSLNHGLGPFSPCLERIQDSNNLVHGSRMNASSVYIGKKMLFQCMHRHFLSLISVLKKSMVHYNISNDEIEKYQKHYEHVKESQVLTVSILKKCRQYNADILSLVLSTILNKNQGCYFKLMVDLLETNILQSKELGTYINSYFDCGEIPSTHSTNAVVDGLVCIQKHLNATQIAVWSYLKSIQSSSSSDEEQEKRIEQEMELFHHITSLFRQASAACTHLSDVLYPEKASTNKNEVNHEAKADSAICAQDAITYDDKGVDDVTPHYQDESNQLHQLRTLVFSGRGLKSNTNNNSGFVDDFESSSHTFSAYTSGRIQLLSELQARLTLMDFGEEINADTSDDLSIKHDQVAQEEKSERKSLKNSPTQNDFIVPRGLLLELQGKICADSDVHILEYEQVSDDRLEYDQSR